MKKRNRKKKKKNLYYNIQKRNSAYRGKGKHSLYLVMKKIPFIIKYIRICLKI